jgi:hypothetical protein
MKMKNVLLISVAAVFILATASTFTDSGRAGRTNSPGESTCASCHNNVPLNAGPGSISIATNIPGNTYTPGQTYTITVTVSEATKILFGIGVEALDATNANAGTLVITNTAETHLLTASNGRINVVQQLNGGLVSAPGGTKSFSFDWQAPATDIGYVKFYAAGVAANANNDETDDNTYSTFLSISSPTVTATADLPETLSFAVYPNPVKDDIHLYLPSGSLNGGNTRAALYSLGGQLITEFVGAPATGTLSLPVPAGVSNGVYFVRLEQGDRSSTRRVMIQR